jgi:uncharacterized membrane protein HdeD (DUF308 family)
MTSSTHFGPTNPISGDAVLAEDGRVERTLWWLAVAGAAASVILGIMVVSWPDATLLVGAVLFGAWLLVHGVIHIVDAVTARAADGAARALTGVLGILFVVAGVICLRNVLVSLLAVATIIGVTWLIGGIVSLVSAFGDRYQGPARWLVAALGAVTVLGGLVVLLWPGPTLAAIVYFTGIWLFVMGAVQLVIVLRSRPTAA